MSDGFMAETNSLEIYIERLGNRLGPHYTSGPKNANPAYGWNHIREMQMLGPKLAELDECAGFDLEEYEVAVILHNTDRPPSLRAEIGFPTDRKVTRKEFSAIWAAYLQKQLTDSPFHEAARNRIADAVIQHPKKNDESGDSAL